MEGTSYIGYCSTRINGRVVDSSLFISNHSETDNAVEEEGNALMKLGRARGKLLRLAFNRRLSGSLGLALLGTAIWLRVTDYNWENWISDGFVLVMGATGLALLLTASNGRQSDWDAPSS